MNKKNLAIFTTLCFLIVIPYFVGDSIINALILMLIAALFAQAFNVLCGQAGMLSFGHAAYFGVGTFATIHAMNALDGAGLFPTPFLPLAGGVASLIIGIFAGWFSTKRSGAYFAMITLALAELLHALAPQLKGLFGGESGISAMRMPAFGFSFGSATEVYYLTLFWFILCVVLLYLFTRTPVGKLALGLRENKHRLEFLGYNTHYLSVFVFAVSALFSGIAGGLQALHLEAANYVILETHLSASVVLNSYIGGVSFFWGPALGAGIMTFFGSMVSDLTQSWLLYQGVIFVLVMMFIPKGLAGLLVQWIGLLKGLGYQRTVLPSFYTFLALVLSVSGFVFILESMRVILSSDYKELNKLTTDGEISAISVFNYQWQPDNILIWVVSLIITVIGLIILKVTVGLWHSLNEQNIRNRHQSDKVIDHE